MTTWRNSMPVAGKRGRMSMTIGSRQAIPTANLKLRKVNGAACCKPTFVARKPDPQTLTKYHASSQSNQ